MSAPLSIHPVHGGQLETYAKHYDIANNQWLDLSTGINPKGYPQPKIPDSVFRDLPNEDDGLQQAACKYYGSDDVLMVPGSSWAIQCLPTVLQQYDAQITKVLLPTIGYSEHERAWRASNVEVVFYHYAPTNAQLQDCDVCVLINPNNPSSHLLSSEVVSDMAHQLNTHSGWLMVDEAFIDTQPQNSVIQNQLDNVIVLRSLGKFFGLAGLRVGAIIANDNLLKKCSELLPPWALNNPARFIAKQALQDNEWINQTTLTLMQQSNNLASLCENTFLVKIKSALKIVKTDFFVTLIFDAKHDAFKCHHTLCEQGIYTRLLDNKSGIRIGLPNNTDENWQRLEHAFMQVANELIKEKNDVDVV
ncbi:threonine-phosphate decarboxylase CobD [Pseudomonas sp. HK3]